MANRLTINGVMNIGDRLVSNNGKAAFIMQRDGNFVLYRTSDNMAIWSSKTNGSSAVKAKLQVDGNLVLLDKNNGPVWSTNTRRANNGAPYLEVQDDGNAVLINCVWLFNNGTWSTESQGFRIRPEGNFLTDIGDALNDAGDWISNAVKTAGKAVGSVAETITDAAGEIGNLLGSIPIIGPGLQGFYDWTYGAPYALAGSILKGERIDKAVINSYKSQLNDLHQMAPYVQTAIAFIPAVGPGAAGAISAGFALADGKTIDTAMLEAAKGAVPGGAVAAMAFDAGVAALQGKPVSDVLLAAAPIPDTAKRAVKAGLDIAQDMAQGKPIDQALVNEVYNQLPPEGKKAVDIARSVADGKNLGAVLIDQAGGLLPGDMKKALNVGMALGHGSNLQEIATKTLTSSDFLQSMANKGAAVTDNLVSSARALVPSEAKKGFDIGMGLMGHQVSQHEFTTVRNTMNPSDRKGFDMAASLQIGRVTSPSMGGIPGLAFGTGAPKVADGPPPAPPPNPPPTGAEAAIVAAVNGVRAGDDPKTGKWLYTGGLPPTQALAKIKAENPAFRNVTLADVYRALYKNVNFVSTVNGLNDDEINAYLASLLLDDKNPLPSLQNMMSQDRIGYYFGGRMAKLDYPTIISRLKAWSAKLRTSPNAVIGVELARMSSSVARVAAPAPKPATTAPRLVAAVSSVVAIPPGTDRANRIDEAIRNAADAEEAAKKAAIPVTAEQFQARGAMYLGMMAAYPVGSAMWIDAQLKGMADMRKAVELNTANAAYLMTKGMQGAATETKVDIMTEIAANPSARDGAVIAVKQIASAREGWWSTILRMFGFGPVPSKVQG